MITCTDFMTEIGNYLEGEVADELREQLEAHLTHCHTCHVVVDSTRKTLRVVTDAGSFDLPDSVIRPIAREIMARIRRKDEA